MSPIMTINSLTPNEILSEIREMRAVAKKLTANKAEAKRFLAAVRKRSRPPESKVS